jgi:hypothetical protein
MKTFRILVSLFGVLLFVAGAMELKLRLRSSSLPTQYSVASLEAGAEVTNLSGVIDSHYAVYPAMVFAYRTSDADSKPTGNEFVENIWYPIVSDQHYTNETADASFRIIVKEKVGMMRVRDLPAGVEHKDSQGGMFLDGFHAFGGEERRLLQSAFPNLDFKRVLLFEIGRQRSSIGSISGLLGGGLLLVILPVAYWIRQGFKRRNASESDGAANAAPPNR